MATTKTRIYLRTSHKYRDGWRHLDGEKFVGTVRLTEPTYRDMGDGLDSGPTFTQRVRLPRWLDPVHASQALRDTLGGSGCRHEYDCCGCPTYHVQVVRKTRRDLLVRTSVTYNC